MHKETIIFIKVAVGIIILFLVYGFGDARGYRAGMERSLYKLGGIQYR